MTKNNGALEKATTIHVEVKAIQREVKEGDDKGKKFLSFKIFNKQTGYYEDVKFNQRANNVPKQEGVYKLEVERSEINRYGTEQRKYPLTWISDVVSCKVFEHEVITPKGDDLPF